MPEEKENSSGFKYVYREIVCRNASDSCIKTAQETGFYVVRIPQGQVLGLNPLGSICIVPENCVGLVLNYLDPPLSRFPQFQKKHFIKSPLELSRL